MFFIPAPVVLAKAEAATQAPLLQVGVARRDITPDYPIRLSGYGGRREPNKGIAQRIHAKALAFGGDSEVGPAILLTVDNCGIPAWIRSELLKRLAAKAPIKDERFTICSSHTHCAPMVSGILPNLFGMDIPAEHQIVIDRYTGELVDALEQVALSALAARKPSRIAWGIGHVTFAANRRKYAERPVDHALPLLRITDEGGVVTALLTSYACHCTTIGIDQIHGDWAGCAQEALEREFPGAIALTAIGCGADQNPSPRSSIELAVEHGGALAAEAARLARSTLVPLSNIPDCRIQSIQLAFDAPPSRDEWRQFAASSSPAIAYHARKNLDRMDRGEIIPDSLPYLVQTWIFGNDLAMVFLPGEVVVDYSLHIKTEFDHRRLWVNGYSNDVPAYIPSKRILEEGGYEGGAAMVYYDRPTRFASDIESRIMGAVRGLVPSGFLASKAKEKTEGIAAYSQFSSGSPHLTLPPDLYAVTGNELILYFAHMVLTEKPGQFRFEVDCPVGAINGAAWRFTPLAAHVGKHPLSLRVFDSNGALLAKAASVLHVSAVDAGVPRESCTMLAIGDSLTAAGIYPDEIARLFELSKSPQLKMLGTQTRRPPNSPRKQVAYEGFGGWSWKSFLTRYDLTEPEPGKTNKSPFVFPGNEPPEYKIDVQRYFKERCGDHTPDFITVLLGINDCFRLKADDPIAMDRGITDMLLNAEHLIAELRKAAPKSKIGICLVPPPNDRQSAFTANYKDAYPRWNWRQVQHRIVERQIKHFFGREKENLEIVPTNLSVDTLDGYPQTNAVHPNEAGYRQIASAIYAWMKHRLTEH